MRTVTYSEVDLPDDIQRLRRLQSLAWLLDNSIVLPGGYRIGVDALIGLIPVFGDAVGALLSAYIVNEARALGAPRSVIIRMMTNVAVEAVVGAIPLFGDVFDAAFKANSRNLALLTRYQRDPRGSRRASRLFVMGVTLLMILVICLMVAIPVLIAATLVKML